MNYKFIRDGIEETVTREKWCWGVVYQDGTELKQFGDDGMFHQFKEINQDDIKMFVMYKPDEENKRIDMPVTNKQVFHFYRNVVLENGTRHLKVYVFGWIDITSGKRMYTFILPDDRCIITDDDIKQLSHYNI